MSYDSGFLATGPKRKLVFEGVLEQQRKDEHDAKAQVQKLSILKSLIKRHTDDLHSIQSKITQIVKSSSAAAGKNVQLARLRLDEYRAARDLNVARKGVRDALSTPAIKRMGMVAMTEQIIPLAKLDIQSRAALIPYASFEDTSQYAYVTQWSKALDEPTLMTDLKEEIAAASEATAATASASASASAAAATSVIRSEIQQQEWQWKQEAAAIKKALRDAVQAKDTLLARYSDAEFSRLGYKGMFIPHSEDTKEEAAERKRDTELFQLQMKRHSKALQRALFAEADRIKAMIETIMKHATIGMLLSTDNEAKTYRLDLLNFVDEIEKMKAQFSKESSSPFDSKTEQTTTATATASATTSSAAAPAAVDEPFTPYDQSEAYDDADADVQSTSVPLPPPPPEAAASSLGKYWKAASTSSSSGSGANKTNESDWSVPNVASSFNT